MKNKYCSFIYKCIFILVFLSVISFKALPAVKHGLSGGASLLIQNNPYREFAYFDNVKYQYYVKAINPWLVKNTGIGLALSLSYNAVFNNLGIFRIETGFETTGFAAFIINAGGGIRVRVGKKTYMSIETYLSFLQTGTTMSMISETNKMSTYIALFGLKTRLAFETSLNKNMFITPYISYTVYPIKLSTTTNLLINGKRANIIFDSFQLGFEIGRYF